MSSIILVNEWTQKMEKIPSYNNSLKIPVDIIDRHIIIILFSTLGSQISVLPDVCAEVEEQAFGTAPESTTLILLIY